MVARALGAGALALPLALSAGLLADGSYGAIAAALGLGIVVVNFAAHGLSLAWAAGISVNAVQLVALAGFMIRMGAIIGLLVGLDRLSFFSPEIFALAVVASTIALLVYEARLVKSALGGQVTVVPEARAARPPGGRPW